MVKALLSLKARIAKLLSVGFHIIESHNVIKIHNTIRAFAIDKNNISARIFLFSVLFILEKNIIEQIHVAIRIHTKWKLKFCGLNIVNKFERDDGIYVPVSKENET